MRYAEPSIIEALCEFVFVPDTLSDFTIFGRFDAHVAAQLPVRDQVEMMSINVRNVGAGIEQAMHREPRVRFFNREKTRLAQVGPNLLSANVLPPYPHWPEFRRFIFECLDAYIKAAKPQKIERMTLRYIDRIVPPARDQFRLGDWLSTGSAYIPKFLEDSSHSANSRVQKDEGNGQAVVTVVHSEETGAPFIVLDTELSLNEITLDTKTVSAKLDLLHTRVIDIFEACISDQTRKILKPEAT
jgi:uncharacterized protein (TIGR04255 family)